MQITKGDTRSLTAYYKYGDFWGGLHTQPQATSPHALYDKVPYAAQLVSDTPGQRLPINSTVRFPGGSEYKGGSSQHDYQNATAVDLGIPPNKRQQVWQDILSQGPLFRALFKMGVRGFGIYDTWLHIDFRTSGGKQTYNGQPYAFWDDRSLTNKSAMANVEAFSTVPDLSALLSGSPDEERPTTQKWVDRAVTVAWWIVVPSALIFSFILIRKYLRPS
jgi:hypothetical protein